MPKRDADPEQIAAFRLLLDGAGLRPRRSSPVRPVLAVAAGLIAIAAVGFGPRYLASLGANASISLSTAIDGPTITVRGATDLPDGAFVAVEVVQLDEYDRAVAQGAPPETANSPWVLYEYATVAYGRFSVSFDAAGWPPGRAEAAAFFWMQPGQPTGASERFGRDGEALRGPDVVQTADRGRMLQVRTHFKLP